MRRGPLAVSAVVLMTNHLDGVAVDAWMSPLPLNAHDIIAPRRSLAEIPKRRDSFSILSTSNIDDRDTSIHPLVEIGRLLQSVLHDDGDEIATCFCLAGVSWEDGEWDAVTEALGKASSLIQHQSVATTTNEMWKSISLELEDISSIEGCCSVGKPASTPNWMTIQELLQDGGAGISDDDLDSADASADIIKEIDRLLDTI